MSKDKGESAKKCIFCKIISKESPATILYEDNKVKRFIVRLTYPLVCSALFCPTLITPTLPQPWFWSKRNRSNFIKL